MILTISLDVKFRAFGIDFGKSHQEWPIPVPAEAMVFARNLATQVLYDRKGVKLTFTVSTLNGDV